MYNMIIRFHSRLFGVGHKETKFQSQSQFEAKIKSVIDCLCIHMVISLYGVQYYNNGLRDE